MNARNLSRRGEAIRGEERGKMSVDWKGCEVARDRENLFNLLVTQQLENLRKIEIYRSSPSMFFLFLVSLDCKERFVHARL